MKLRFNVTFLQGPTVVALIEGREMQLEGLKVGDITNRVIETEQYLERLTGLRVHIEQVG